MKKLLLIFIVLTLSSISSLDAQILNFNKRTLQNDSVKWLGQINVFFNAIAQEVTVANKGYNFDVVRKLNKHSVMAISKLSFATSDSEILLSDGYAHVRGVFNRNNKFSEEVFGQIQYNAIRGLDDRNLIGAGVRYLLFNEEKYGMLVGVGFIQEWENWTYNEIQTSTSLLKTSNYISFYGDVNEQFHFNVISYYQASLNSIFNPRLSLEINLNLEITEKLKFTSSVTIYYDNKPVVPIDNYVMKFKNGLGYRF